jgi:regulatory protein
MCLRLLQVRPRTRAELEKALRRSGFAKETVAEVLDRYSEVGMIDDEAFARAWVTSRHHSRGLASRALAGELRRKGVPDEAVDAAVDDLGADTEAATARALVERRLRAETATARSVRPAARGARATTRAANGPNAANDALSVRADRSDASRDADADPDADPDLSEDPDEARARRQRAQAALARKLVGMLARKGYRPGLAYRVVREALAEQAGMADTEALADLDRTDDDFDEFDPIRS